MSTAKRPVVLCILDGWGWREGGDDNAIRLGRTPTWDRLVGAVPRTTLDASAEAVGLPSGQMGNSEVGHMNIGAGRVVLQDLPRIDAQIAGDGFAALAPWGRFIDRVGAADGAVHIMGLLSPGGVHAHQDHIVALAQAAAEAGRPVRIHAFLDGRDMPPKSAPDCLRAVQAAIAAMPDVRIATVCGRFFAMDRDQRWDRVARAYDLIVDGVGEPVTDAASAIEAAHAAGTTDEFVEPLAIGGYDGMADGDGVLMANFRADRAREILTALVDPAFDGFERRRVVAFSAALGMVDYSEALSARIPALFPAEIPEDVLGAVVAARGKRQLRIAETEKYAHVTFFLNGGREDVFDGEDRILIPSPKVKTYDLQPEMSASDVTDKLVEAIESGEYDLIVVNYANGDMVGHTGDLDAAVKAVETVDGCLARLEGAVTDVGGAMLVTADHGNCEQMTDRATGGAHTAHTVNPVPLLLIGAPDSVAALQPGRLCDLAPTVLGLMDVPQPAAMTGRSLLVDKGSADAAAAE
jgi:2,3-bisphosphoglycerate-independent phosphoglycerate mutase